MSNLGLQLDVTIVQRGTDPENPYPEAKLWLEENRDRNGFDPEVLTYPATMMLKVGKDGETIGYMPVQSAMFLESVGLRANLSPLEGAQAMLNLSAAAERMAYEIGIREAYFLVTDDITARAAEIVGYEILEYRVMRKRLKVIS